VRSVVFYRDESGQVPFLEWFEQLPQLARVRCFEKIELLAREGHFLRRPHADYLRDGIHELRARHQGVNYRLLYFFHGQQVVVVSHGVTKQRAAVPAIEIERAAERKRRFEADPTAHTHRRD
jgi:phage-related protein